jgi:mono/diheme cytochrome c family protein
MKPRVSEFVFIGGCSILLLASGEARAAQLDLAQLPPAATRPVNFEKEIQPILADRCHSCHGPDKQKGELRLDMKEKALAGGDSGLAIVAGKSAESPLIHFVAGLVADKVMPQKAERLTRQQISLLRAWIDQGAAWPDHLSPQPAHPTNFWAFKPLLRPTPPLVKSRSHPSLPIDRFIIARLQENGLKFSAPADKATLLRRATFDLTGLPPTLAELRGFIADSSPEAFARVVDRLLASPHYGERWARHWLDLARFSESAGFEFDKMREHAWPYRDYLIHSFNEDKPYGQFVREQIAGDALAPATRDSIIATAFLTAGPYDEAGNTSASALLKARIREEEMEDMISAVSQTFLAMTVNCARCHDHKFDPIPQADYYRLKAALDGVRHGNRPFLTTSESEARETRVAQLKSRLRQSEKEVAEMEAAARSVAREARKQSAVAGEGAPLLSLPAPMARWTFESDAKDLLGNLHGSLNGGAKIAHGRLVLDGKTGFMRTEPIVRPLREKTLEAWLRVSDLAQRGGGVMSVEAKADGVFDGIVFGERVPRKWMAGSSFFQRSRDFTAPDEDAPSGELVHVAAVYRADHSITVYRNGQVYGETYTPAGPNGTLQTYAADGAHILLGLRHTGAGNGFFAGEIEEARLYDTALSAAEIETCARAVGAVGVTPDDLVKAMTPDQRRQRDALIAETAQLEKKLKAIPPVPQVYAAVSREPEPTFVLARGDVEKKKQLVTAGGLSAVTAPRADFGLPAAEPEARRRLKLADWMVHPDNPLTWRVMANRVWHHHFGRGLAGTPNDFGVNGERPSHPELLDWLAGELIAQGGSLKKLHRLIMTSAVYQQASASEEPKLQAVDAENRLLGHFPLRRLEAEAVRDAMLSVSGQLNPAIGGPGFRPFKVTISGSHFYELTDPLGPEFNRRTIYRMNIQSGKDPLLDSLDCPDPSTKTPARGITTTPIQSLGLMNNAFVQRQCQHFARRLEREAGRNAGQQIKLGYQLAFGREPRAVETKQTLALAREHGLESVCWVLLNTSEFLYLR